MIVLQFRLIGQRRFPRMEEVPLPFLAKLSMFLQFLSIWELGATPTFVTFNDINTFRKPCNFTFTKKNLTFDCSIFGLL